MFEYKSSHDLLKGRTILVTGAGSGIGRTAALTFARHGATVILLGRTIGKLESVYDEIEGNGWPKPAIYPMNLEGAAENDYVHLAETIEQEFGKLDGLLHNAGLLGELKPIGQYPTETWLQLMQVNLNAPFIMTREITAIAERSRGRISHLHIIQRWS